MPPARLLISARHMPADARDICYYYTMLYTPAQANNMERNGFAAFYESALRSALRMRR